MKPQRSQRYTLNNLSVLCGYIFKILTGIKGEKMKISFGQEEPKTIISTTSSAQQHRLIEVKKGLNEKLRLANPGELLSWWITEDAFELPSQTILDLRKGGEALTGFFSVASKLFYEERWIQKRLEKKLTPNYHLLNRVQHHALPLLPRPDVILDRDWHPKFVELEIAVGSRADTSLMAEQYNLNAENSLVRSYSELIKKRWPGMNLALVSAPHPFFLDLPDDAKAFASLLRRQGLEVIVLTGENLSHLRFDGRNLVLCRRNGAPIPIHIIDRFIDIYEIAELQHPGMAALLDAYLAGVLIDLNTCKQFLDEKDWMALFWEPRLRKTWQNELGQEYDHLLRSIIPRTWLLAIDTQVELPCGQRVPILKVSELLAKDRLFVIKESGTSSTSSGAQSLKVLSEMKGKEVYALLRNIIKNKVPFVIQEIVDSPRITFTALDPDNDRMITQQGARLKLSVFYVDGKMTDIRFVASNVKLAVNDQDFVVSVIRYDV